MIKVTHLELGEVAEGSFEQIQDWMKALVAIDVDPAGFVHISGGNKAEVEVYIAQLNKSYNWTLETDSFDVFEDRIQSLLVRWRQWKDQGHSPSVAIRGCLQEINDGFANLILKEGK